ncbi:MAG: hypothetical protein COA79_16775 [Planctomycetota bacterium]|nr:MAG: hypothetical protein COA79_16775 [Planctomycetota bacterium]
MKNFGRIMWVLFILCLISSVCLLAQEPAASSTGESGGSSYFELYTKGGLIGYFITILSVISMTLFIMYAIQMQRDKLIPNYVINELENCIEEDEIESGLDFCEGEEAPIAKIMGAALSRFESGPDKMIDAMIESSEEQANLLATKIGWLSLIGGLAPMIGLFGTVSGMIKAFDTIASSAGTASPEDLARGIMEALVTTFLGLFVAIPSVAGYHFLRNRVNSIVIETNNICSDLLDKVNQS